MSLRGNLGCESKLVGIIKNGGADKQRKCVFIQHLKVKNLVLLAWRKYVVMAQLGEQPFDSYTSTLEGKKPLPVRWCSSSGSEPSHMEWEKSAPRERHLRRQG